MSFARPDEIATDSRIRANNDRDQIIKSGAKSLGTAALIAGGAGITARIAPFLSELIPTDLALKGISKVAPKVGEFIKKGMAQGLSIKSGLDFLKENMSGAKQSEPEKQEKASDQRSIIEKYSPELNQFLQGEIQKGRSPLEAGALAEMGGKFKDAIKKMVKDHKTPFSSILESIFGSGDQAQKKKPMNREEALGGFRDKIMQDNQQGQPQTAGKGQQALMAILQKIQQSRGA